MLKKWKNEMMVRKKDEQIHWTISFNGIFFLGTLEEIYLELKQSKEKWRINLNQHKVQKYRAKCFLK